MEKRSKQIDFYKDRVWILITGNIRDESQVYDRLCFFGQLKSESLVGGIVFSTWVDEAKKYPRIREQLIAMDAIVVESIQPSIVVRGHYLHQIIQLENGLDACPDDCFILRTRTDKCGEESGFYENDIRNLLIKQEYVRSCRKGSVLEYKLGTWGVPTRHSLDRPVLFFWLDRWYFGYKHDLQKFINYSVLSFDYLQLIPEQVLFLSVFGNIHNSLMLYVKAVNQFATVSLYQTPNSKINDAKIGDELTAFLCANRLFRDAFLAERVIINQYLYDVTNNNNDIPLITQYKETELLYSDNFDNDKSKAQRGYTFEIEELKEYFFKHFDISPVQSKQILREEVQYYRYSAPTINNYYKDIAPIVDKHTDDFTQLFGNGKMDILEFVVSSTEIWVKVSIKNASNYSWISNAAPFINIAYHWYNDINEVVLWDGLRTPLLHDIPSHQSMIAEIIVKERPSLSGNYMLMLTLIAEGTFWFEFQGFKPAVLVVTV